MIKTILLRLFIASLILSLALNNIVLAFDVTGQFNGQIDSNAQSSADSVKDVLLAVLSAVRIAGVAIAIIMLIMVGIKIMMASPSERANVKQYSINYVIGAFILFGASGILTIIKSVADSAFSS